MTKKTSKRTAQKTKKPTVLKTNNTRILAEFLHEHTLEWTKSANICFEKDLLKFSDKAKEFSEKLKKADLGCRAPAVKELFELAIGESIPNITPPTPKKVYTKAGIIIYFQKTLYLYVGDNVRRDKSSTTTFVESIMSVDITIPTVDEIYDFLLFIIDAGYTIFVISEKFKELNITLIPNKEK